MAADEQHLAQIHYVANMNKIPRNKRDLKGKPLVSVDNQPDLMPKFDEDGNEIMSSSPKVQKERGQSAPAKFTFFKNLKDNQSQADRILGMQYQLSRN